MRWELILVFLLVLPISCALEVANYSNYESISLLYSASSEINAYVKGDSPKFMDLTVKLNLFPISDNGQEVLSQEILTSPKTYVNFDPDYDKEIEINWDNIDNTKISYNLDSKVLSKNKISLIKDSKFPVSIPKGIDKYTKAAEFIDLNGDISEKAKEIIGAEDNLFVVTYSLAEWVRQNINYDINTLTEDVVQKSSWVLVTRQGVCDELTNLFISFCRSLGIPARFITGVAYSNTVSGFGNHGWAEVYFPDYGWVPFDVTYGEYGWLDATHLKLSEDIDSNVYSVQYNWKSRDLEVETEDLFTDVKLLNLGNKITPLTRVDVNLLENYVDFGSYIPVQVVIENLMDSYIADKIYFTKAPKLVEDNVRVVLLKPGEIKEEYWLVQIPADMKAGYKYSSVVNVESGFGSSAMTNIEFSKSGDYVSRADAQKKVDELKKREVKKYFLNLDFNCNLDKEKIYSNENVDVKCKLKNRDNKGLNNLQVCLREECLPLDLNVDEEKEVTFNTYATNKIPAIVENNEMIKYVFLEPYIIEVPNIEISDLEPTSIDYSEKKKFNFIIETDYDAYDVEVKVENKKSKFDVLSGRRLMDIELSGNKLINGLDIKITYKDEEGKKYTIKEKLNVAVNNSPWYSRMFSWVVSTI